MTKDPLLTEATKLFEKEYGRKPAVIAAAPGRVNLIGEHTDYNDGLVLPMAIRQKILTLVCPRNDHMVHAKSLQVGKPASFETSDRFKKGQWDDAIKGVIDQLEKQGVSWPGMDILFSGDVPLEAGLSSSAAFTVSCALALATLAGFEIKPKDLALLAQRVENQFMGTQCGILDQMASAATIEGHALLLDCKDLSFRQVPIPDNFEIVVCHTGVTRALAASGYNDRRGECALGLQKLSTHFHSLKGMRDVTFEMLQEMDGKMEDVLIRRLTHVLTENARVKKACQCLESADLTTLGALFTQSHESLRDDYEVSCVELDTMVDLALGQKGCFGARMVGGGFGGCAIALVSPDLVQNFCDRMAKMYCEKIPDQTGKYIPVCPGNGVNILKDTKV